MPPKRESRLQRVKKVVVVKPTFEQRNKVHLTKPEDSSLLLLQDKDGAMAGISAVNHHPAHKPEDQGLTALPHDKLGQDAYYGVLNGSELGVSQQHVLQVKGLSLDYRVTLSVVVEPSQELPHVRQGIEKTLGERSGFTTLAGPSPATQGSSVPNSRHAVLPENNPFFNHRARFDNRARNNNQHHGRGAGRSRRNHHRGSSNHRTDARTDDNRPPPPPNRQSHHNRVSKPASRSHIERPYSQQALGIAQKARATTEEQFLGNVGYQAANGNAIYQARQTGATSSGSSASAVKHTRVTDSGRGSPATGANAIELSTSKLATSSSSAAEQTVLCCCLNNEHALRRPQQLH
ncbi:hypothetical protein B0T21DRAFT_394731 [Apiosordaria backusii]|uniref:Uncharacterized protein n=1 Tax=Apiosordaria backusii TaxID=314023 RepID=A0AA40E3X2_9PEZI|nr:hypothetical protein B0T21DRAFT_394731 [Apiosordaria backusii]